MCGYYPGSRFSRQQWRIVKPYRQNNCAIRRIHTRLRRPHAHNSDLMATLKQEIAAQAARLVVEEGLDYGSAKRRAFKQIGQPVRGELPRNDEIEDEVRAYLALFYADSQPRELAALRRLAVHWMARMAQFRPYLAGSVWHGTATWRSDIFIQLFCDDPKSAEIALLDQRVGFEPRSVGGMQGEPVEALSVSAHCAELDESIGVHFIVYDLDDLRGALRLDAKGRVPRGDLAGVRRLLESPGHA